MFDQKTINNAFALPECCRMGSYSATDNLFGEVRHNKTNYYCWERIRAFRFNKSVEQSQGEMLSKAQIHLFRNLEIAHVTRGIRTTYHRVSPSATKTSEWTSAQYTGPQNLGDVINPGQTWPLGTEYVLM